MGNKAKANAAQLLLKVTQWVVIILMVAAVGGLLFYRLLGLHNFTVLAWLVTVIVGCAMGGAVINAITSRQFAAPPESLNTNAPTNTSRIVMPLPATATNTASSEDFQANPWDSTARQIAVAAFAPVRPQPDLTGPHWVITYQSNRADVVRAEVWNITHRGWDKDRLMVYFVPPALVTALGWSLWLPWGGWGLVTAYFVSLLIWLCLFAALVWNAICTKFPTPDTVSGGHAALTPTGFCDIMDDKTGFAPWASVKSLVQNNGDFVIRYRNPVTGAVSGNVIIGAGFPDRETADQFYQSAVTLWKSNGRDLPPTLRRAATPIQTTDFALD